MKLYEVGWEGKRIRQIQTMSTKGGKAHHREKSWGFKHHTRGEKGESLTRRGVLQMGGERQLLAVYGGQRTAGKKKKKGIWVRFWKGEVGSPKMQTDKTLKGRTGKVGFDKSLGGGKSERRTKRGKRIRFKARRTGRRFTLVVGSSIPNKKWS